MSETALIAATAARIFARHAGDGAALWRALEEAGLTAAATAEAQGGPGLGPEVVLALARAAGAAAAPVPLAETLVAARLLSAAGLTPPAGMLTFAMGGALDAAGLTAALPETPFGTEAGHVAVLAEGPAGPVVALMATEDAAARPALHVGEDPAADLSFAAARPVAHAPAPFGPARLTAEAALIRAAQIAGAAEAALDLTLGHVAAREQFGRPLARFQAIQHMLAEMAGEIAAAGAAVDAAAAADEAGFETAAAIAKLRAAEAAGLVAAHAHQCHGALGYTGEYALRPLTRRLWRWREEFGDETHWALILGRAAGAPAAPTLTAALLGAAEPG